MKFRPGKTIKRDKPELPIEHRIRAAHFRFGFGTGIAAAMWHGYTDDFIRAGRTDDFLEWPLLRQLWAL